jgi:hypothetical protein
MFEGRHNPDTKYRLQYNGKNKTRNKSSDNMNSNQI